MYCTRRVISVYETSTVWTGEKRTLPPILHPGSSWSSRSATPPGRPTTTSDLIVRTESTKSGRIGQLECIGCISEDGTHREALRARWRGVRC